MREITGGNNSETGAYNHETLMTLVETANLHEAYSLKLMLSLASNMDIPKINAAVFGKTQRKVFLNVLHRPK